MITVEKAEATVQLTSGRRKESACTRPNPLLLLGLLVALSFAVRVAALFFWGTGAIESEGANYARIAENLRRGVGYVGLNTPGTDLTFAPLYPLLICGASFMTGNFVDAGRLISLILGAFLPLPALGIASQLFNRRTALVAALLTTLHPLFVNLSFSVLSESAYITILLLAVFLVLRALKAPSFRIWCLVGAGFGLAYLVRQEAVAPLLIAALFALTATEGRMLVRCKRAAAATVVFAAVAAPEVFFIHEHTGKFRLEAKGTMFFAMSTRILAVQPEMNPDHRVPPEALYAVDANLQPNGTAMRPNADVIAETRITAKQLARIEKKAVRQNLPILLQQLSSRWLGAPLLPALAVLGFFRMPWRQPLVSSHLFFLMVPAAAVLAIFSALWTDARFYFVLLPFLLIWAANGLVGVGLWAKRSAAAARWPRLNPVVPEWIFAGLIGSAVIIYPIKGVREVWEFAQGSPSTQIVKDVGQWIRQQQNRQVKIMDLSTPLAYHADAQYVHFPYCSGGSALRFLDSANVDYIVLRRGALAYGDETPYSEDWLAHGIPDARAQLVYRSSGEHGGEFQVFRWHRDPDRP
jgi:4-amino-4-deoxy-L-arabinose transferase-like glycosyltransferase